MQSTPLVLFAALGLAAAAPAQLAGGYVVGPGGDYANIAAAIAALVGNGVAGPVSFLVTANDTGPWTLPPFPGQGPQNPVLFDGQGTVTIGGAQPVLTLDGCASVTLRGFNGTFVSSAVGILVRGSTADCVFTACDLRAPSSTGGSALIHFAGGTRCRIEDSTFGGAYQALLSDVANSATIIRRCRITGGGWRILTLGGTDCVLENNFITGTTNYGINAGIPGTPTSGVNLKIRHNSVFINHPTSGSQYCSLRWYTSDPGTEVVNNIFFDFFPTATTSTFNLWCSGSLRPAVMDFNCLWSNQPGYAPVYASGNRTLAAWQALGFDQNSIQADPQYLAQTATPADLRIATASPCAMAGLAQAAVATDFFQAARSAPVSIGGHEEASGTGAHYAVFGAGCAGSAGVPGNTAWPPPALGQSSVVTFNNLPVPYLVVAVLALSNTTSLFGPLPYRLGLFGAPACSLRVSLDVSLFTIGSAGAATLTLQPPNLPQLIGLQLYTQGLVLDPLQNAMGAVTSDAASLYVAL